MIKYHKWLLFYLSLMLLLVSCVLSEQPTLVVMPTHEATQTDLVTVVAPTPTRESLANTPKQVTDGKLRLTIREFDRKCHSPKDIIHLIFTYENLTDHPLKIADYDVISIYTLFRSEGQLYPVIFTTNNVQIFTPEDFMFVQAMNPNPSIFYDLAAKSALDVSVEKYHFPPEILKFDENGRREAYATPPGEYLLKFLYAGYGRDNTWNGDISSNQIKICIEE